MSEVLFTNFSAGELSDTLFGRVDISQYRRGVSKLVNFDVIPTGGITSRHGSKRLGSLLGKCRLIPLIINKQYSFLIELGIGYIRFWNRGQLITDGTGTPIIIDHFTTTGIDDDTIDISLTQAFTESALPEIQFAQTYDRLVLVHQNFPPLMLVWGGSSGLNNASFIFSKIEFNFSVTKEVNDQYGKYDTTEEVIDKQDGALGEPGYYPRAVAFFNSRLWFGGCAEKPQMIWASEAQDENQHYSDFSTFRRYVTTVKIPGDQDIHIFSGQTSENSYVITEVSQDLRDLSNQKGSLGEFTAATTQNSIVIKIKRTGKSILDKYARIEVPAKVDDQSDIEKKRFSSTKKAFQNRVVPLLPSTDIKNLYVRSSYFPSGTKITSYVNFFSLTVHTTQAATGFFDGSVEVAISIDPIPSSWKLKGKDIPADTTINAIYLIEENNALYYRVTLSKAATSSQSASLILLTENSTATEYYLHSSGYFPIGTKFVGATENTITVDKAAIRTSGEEAYGGTMHYFPVTLYLSKWKVLNEPDEDSDYEYKTEIADITVPANAFRFEIASDQLDSIIWFAQNRHLIIGTESSEWIVPSGVSATNLQTQLNSRYSSHSIQALCIGQAIIFFGAGGRTIREYYLQEGFDIFKVNDLAMLAPQMLHESQAIDFDYTSSPYTRIIITRQDGTLAILLYEKTSGNMAWYRYTIASGHVVSCATMPSENGFDEVYLAVKSPDGGYYLERIEDTAAIFLDGYSPYNAGNISKYNGTGAIIYDYTDHKAYALNETIPEGHSAFIGFPYTQIMHSLPVITNEPNGKKRIVATLFRFKDSFFPVINASPQTLPEIITGYSEPFTGVIKTPFPGDFDRDVIYKLTVEKPERCTVLTVNTEVT
jgi:hypothetical protein